MYKLYKILTANTAPALDLLLAHRLKKGKEDLRRVNEKKGVTSLTRPDGHLIWIHAASIGEAQSTLILVNRLLSKYSDIYILVTTGTLTSATIMAQKLPTRTFHQFYPLDHPEWTARFLEHWKPDLVLWMESELWPNMLTQIKERKIPALLINARLSKRSFSRWKHFTSFAKQLFAGFSKILCQTENDAVHFEQLGAENTLVTGNLKFSASPLAFEKSDFQDLTAFTTGRPLWLFASTHKGEEEMACRIHELLKASLPDLLTLIVPRHPERRHEIANACKSFNLKIAFRGSEKIIPKPEDDIYIADTLGELGLFYRLAPVACVGRSFSEDGGGGHNPIEPAQLGCVVLHGPNIQNLQEIYDLMDSAGASLPIDSEIHLRNTVLELLTNEGKRQTLQNKALNFTRARIGVADVVLDEISKIIHKETSIHAN